LDFLSFETKFWEKALCTDVNLRPRLQSRKEISRKNLCSEKFRKNTTNIDIFPNLFFRMDWKCVWLLNVLCWTLLNLQKNRQIGHFILQKSLKISSFVSGFCRHFFLENSYPMGSLGIITTKTMLVNITSAKKWSRICFLRRTTLTLTLPNKNVNFFSGFWIELNELPTKSNSENPKNFIGLNWIFQFNLI
jgi:hypothetical protein